MTHSERRPFSTKARWALQITSCSKKKKKKKKKKPHTPTDSTLEPINSQISFLYLPRHFLPTFGFSPPLPLPPLSIYARGKSCSFKWTFWNPLFYARVFFLPCSAHLWAWKSVWRCSVKMWRRIFKNKIFSGSSWILIWKAAGILK